MFTLIRNEGSKKNGYEEAYLLLATCFVFFPLTCLVIRPWRWKKYVPSKFRLNLNGLHGAIFEETCLFIVLIQLISTSKLLHRTYCPSWVIFSVYVVRLKNHTNLSIVIWCYIFIRHHHPLFERPKIFDEDFSAIFSIFLILTLSWAHTHVFSSAFCSVNLKLCSIHSVK
jgi:hypothetical protein